MKNPESRQASSGFKQASLLPDAHFTPIFPTKNTLPARCLYLMLTGQSLTHPEFEVLTGSWRLAAVVHALKELGWPVESLDLPAPSPECPTRCISRYSLPADAIHAVAGGGYDYDGGFYSAAHYADWVERGVVGIDDEDTKPSPKLSDYDADFEIPFNEKIRGAQ